MKTRAAVAIALLLAAFSARAAIRITRDGEIARDAELCYYAAVGTDNPFVQQFSSNMVKCSRTLPAGLWNVYARQGTGLISARVVLIDSRKPNPDIELQLEPAATIELPPGGAIYLTDTVSLFPGPMVPADRDLLPLRVENRIIVGVGSIVHPKAGENVSVGSLASQALVTWLSIAPSDLEALRTARKPRPPQVVANGRIKPLNPVTGTVNIDKVLQIFRGLPPGDVSLELSGAPWKRQQMRVVQEARVVATEQPLRLIPTSSVVVDWYAASNLADLADRLVSDCQPSKEHAAFTAAVLKCPSLFDRERCSAISNVTMPDDQRSGVLRFDDLQPGKYLLDVRYRDLPDITREITVGKFAEESVRLPIEYTTLFGKVTIAGKEPPAPMKIDFNWNVPPRAMTDVHGEYFAVLAKPLVKDRVIHLRTCDGTTDTQFIIDRDVAPNSRFDIDLPSNKLVVEAVDARSGGPVAGALVRYGAFRSEEMSSTYYFRLAMQNDTPARTGSDGKYTVENISQDKTIHICLEHDDYERTCPDTFKMTSDETKTLRVPMQPRSAYRGRITAPQPIAAGQIYWYSADGQQMESVPVKEDGSFRFNRQHGPDEVLALVSINVPLFVARQPQFDDVLEIAIPSAPVRRFEVALSEESAQTDALVTIAVGEIIVPYPAFSQHLALRGSTLDLRNRGPLLVPDILETGPITVLLGPPPSTVTPSRNDLFRLPQYRNVPRKPVTGPMVIFGR
jgi:hypothetical protein